MGIETSNDSTCELYDDNTYASSSSYKGFMGDILWSNKLKMNAFCMLAQDLYEYKGGVTMCDDHKVHWVKGQLPER